MSFFYTYLSLGLDHITDVQGYDHILFLLVLSALYPLSEWKKILVLVTAFTIGHSLSLACAALGIFQVNSAWIEFLIPVTILLTCVLNLYETKFELKQSDKLVYILALVFGLIHGLGFSNFFAAIYSDQMSIVLPLFSFNLGLEIGQLIIVLIFMLLKFMLSLVPRFSKQDWTIFISGIGFGLSLMMMLERFSAL
jgi:hypothetical protein